MPPELAAEIRQKIAQMQMRKPHTINARLTNPLTREETLLELAEWVKDTCLFFGTSASLAYKIASMFIAGLEYDVPVNEN